MQSAIKQFLYTVSVLLISALLALVIMGLFMEEVRYTATVRIKAPVADSWNTFMDLDQQSIWQENLELIEPVYGKPMSTGASFRMEFSNGISRMETVTSVIPMQEYNANIETERYSGFRSVTFQVSGDGSRVQQTTVMRGSSFTSRAVLPVLRPFMQHNQIVALDRLANLTGTSPSNAPLTDG